MVRNEGATPGAILSATPGATPRQRPVNGGATHTPYTPSVAPALGGWVHAANGGRHLVPMPPFSSGYETGGLTCAFALCAQKGTVQFPSSTKAPKREPLQSSSRQKRPTWVRQNFPVSLSIRIEVGQFVSSTVLATTARSSPPTNSHSVPLQKKVHSSRSNCTRADQVCRASEGWHTKSTGSAITGFAKSTARKNANRMSAYPCCLGGTLA